ncbi:helix-turn-helix transcriptional regulator [Kocuria sp. M1R5S2]|uniref:helix-turn-helix transcriptional regulator n=1 Tax=Kocuria rhizosphaerae TaxID=3376285 RepID=UPI00378DD0CA
MASAEERAGTAPFREQGGQGDRESAGAGPVPVRSRVATDDPDVAGDRLRQTYAKAEMLVPRDAPGFGFRQDVDGDSDLSLARFRLEGHARVRAELDDVVTVVRRRSGGHDWDVGGLRGTGLMLIQPHDSYRAELELLTVDAVNFSLAVLRRTALDVYGRDAGSVVFDHPRPAGRSQEKYWSTTHDFVRRALADPAVESAPLLRADLLRRLTVATLEGFPRGDVTGRTRRSSTAARAAACRRAVSFMHDARALPITLEDVARHVGLSTLELGRALRVHRGTTPGNVLRELRLEAAHEDLVRGDPAAGDTVRGIALRWAFPDPGDFVRRHRVRYGAGPAAALRARARPRSR